MGAGLLAAAIGASAQEATPTPTPSPVPTSTITVRFVQDGEPVEVFLNEPLNRLLADEVDCTPEVPAIAGPSEGYSIKWPLVAMTEAPAECKKGPPTTLRFEFQSGERFLVAEFVWQGEDVNFDLEVPSELFISETPLPPLPKTGSAPSDAAAIPPLAFGLAAAALMALLLAVSLFKLAGR